MTSEKMPDLLGMDFDRETLRPLQTESVQPLEPQQLKRIKGVEERGQMYS